MAYLGNSSTQQSFTPAIDYFNGDGSTTAFTLSRPVASVAQIQVTINNVAQNPSSAYTVSNNTITFTSAPLSGTNNIYVYYTSPNTQVIAPSQGTVSVNSLDSTFVLPVIDGGTGVTTSTGSGANVLGTSPSLTSPTLTTPNINSAQIPTVSGTAPLYMARAWVNFNGTGTVAIRASGNVTSITDGGVGLYTLNFTTAMTDADYCLAGITAFSVSAGAESVRIQSTLTSSAAPISTTTAGVLFDSPTVTVAVFR
jgi:hypothetical protein